MVQSVRATWVARLEDASRESEARRERAMAVLSSSSLCPQSALPSNSSLSPLTPILVPILLSHIALSRGGQLCLSRRVVARHYLKIDIPVLQIQSKDLLAVFMGE